MNKAVTILVIVQSVLIAILFIVLVVIPKEQVNEDKIEYERITKDFERVIEDMKINISLIKAETKVVIHKIDSMKADLPKQRRYLNKIQKDIKNLNDAYIYRNYSDSAAAILIERLSR